MIFISTGSRKFQFNRLIEEIDTLVAQGKIEDDVFAQIAETTYIPKYIKYEKYLSPEQFTEYQQKATIIITHAGTGALIGALKLGKQVISVPRLCKYGEHSDDHQLQVSGALASEGFLREVLDIKDLGNVIAECKVNHIVKKYDKPTNIVPLIEKQIDVWFAVNTIKAKR